ncbi:DUF1330 domain-containing protein [Cupriavidus sp. D384]|uniref:DUF1330 domain-containing protein n=1 Tax=Cupriavidus sp. D384 TaxID=1538095 RepID=UPI00082C9FEA|nr:DUF1330 domain-containing protein [Cupriavidus sp. D384]
MKLRKIRLFFPAGLALLSALPVAVTHAQTPEQHQSMAYYIAEFEPTVPGAIQPYSARVEATFKPFGGRFIVRGGNLEPLEGTPPNGRLIIIAFDSVDQARAWYNSPAYEAIKPIRHQAGTSNVYIVPGVIPIP